jgi:hypothetical protein
MVTVGGIFQKKKGWASDRMKRAELRKILA